MRHADSVLAKIVRRSCTICGFHSSSCQPMNCTRRWSLFCSGLVLKVVQRTNLHSTSELLPMVFISWRSSLVEHNGMRRITSCRRTIGLFFRGNIFFVGQYCPSSPESWTENERWNNCVSCGGMRREVGLVAGRWIAGLKRSVCVWWAAAWMSGGLKTRRVAADIDTVSSSVWSPHSSHSGTGTIYKYSMIPKSWKKSINEGV